MNTPSAIGTAILLALWACAPALAGPIQSWTVAGSLENVNDFNILQGSNTFLLEVFVDPDTPDLSTGGRAGFYAATATLTVGVVHESFPVKIGISPNGGLGDNLQIAFDSTDNPPPPGWSQWSVSFNFLDTTNGLPFTGELPAFPLTLDDFNQSNGQIFVGRPDPVASLLATPVVTTLQTPEPTSATLLTTAMLLLVRRRRTP